MSYPKKGDIYKMQGYDRPDEYYLILDKHPQSKTFQALCLNVGKITYIIPHSAIWTKVA